MTMTTHSHTQQPMIRLLETLSTVFSIG